MTTRRDFLALASRVANQVPFGQMDNALGPDGKYDTDKWDGYLAERGALTAAFGRRGGSGPRLRHR